MLLVQRTHIQIPFYDELEHWGPTLTGVRMGQGWFLIAVDRGRLRHLYRQLSLEREMATDFVFLPGKFHGLKEPGRLQYMWSQRIRHDSVDEHACKGSCRSPSRGL